MNGPRRTVASSSTKVGCIDDDVRHQMVVLIRLGSYDSSFSRRRPTKWQPTRVRNPEGGVDHCFTDETAWAFVADRLERGEHVRVIELKKPPGRKGYVMRIDIGSDVPRLYVKLELVQARVWGRSFHQ